MPLPSQPDLPSGWIRCPECEIPCRDRDLPKRSEIRCKRCGARVKRASQATAIQTSCALATAGLILVVLANIEPILTFDVSGNTQTNHIVTGVIDLTRQGYGPVAFLVLFSAIIAPALHLLAIWYVSAACCAHAQWPAWNTVLVWTERLAPWSLVPIYAVGILVSVVKLDMLGEVEWQRGALWILALSACTLTLSQKFDPSAVEELLGQTA